MKTKQDCIDYELSKQMVKDSKDKGIISEDELTIMLEYLYKEFSDKTGTVIPDDRVTFIINKIEVLYE